MGPGLIIDVAKLFEGQFGSKPYVVPGVSETKAPGETFRGLPAKQEQQYTAKGSLLSEQHYGIEIWLPVKIIVGPITISLPYSVVKVSRKNTFIKTALIERRGTVKELFSADDYMITIKGFLIDKAQRQFPEAEITQLKNLCDLRTDVILDNALTNIFLSEKDAPAREQRRVVVESFELPEVSGGRKHVRPFVMELLSDSVFTLELT